MAVLLVLLAGLVPALAQAQVPASGLERQAKAAHLYKLASFVEWPPASFGANAMPREIERGLDSGCYRYLTKPMNIDEFNVAIDSTLAMMDKLRQESSPNSRGGEQA